MAVAAHLPPSLGGTPDAVTGILFEILLAWSSGVWVVLARLWSLSAAEASLTTGSCEKSVAEASLTTGFCEKSVAEASLTTGFCEKSVAEALIIG